MYTVQSWPSRPHEFSIIHSKKLQFKIWFQPSILEKHTHVQWQLPCTYNGQFCRLSLQGRYRYLPKRIVTKRDFFLKKNRVMFCWVQSATVQFWYLYVLLIYWSIHQFICVWTSIKQHYSYKNCELWSYEGYKGTTERDKQQWIKHYLHDKDSVSSAESIDKTWGCNTCELQ